jgi:DNA-binding NarL/FixJ family response regulator
MPVRILIVDDHEVVRQGLRTILNARPQWEIVGEAENGREAIDLTRQLRPDVVILDITMPIMSGLEATQELEKSFPAARVLIFTMHDSKSLIKAVRKAGARGYVLKSRAARDLIHAVEALLDGNTFFGPDGANGEEEKDKAASKNLLFCRALQFAF